MAVIISNGNTSLSTASGFYRVEAHNLGMFSTTELALSSTRTIAVTFANAGACQGLLLCLAFSTGSLTTNLKSVVVTLQENVASVWTDRATVTYSAATITNSATNARGKWIVPFTGGTFPYTVTTAASTWRFQVSQTGAQSNNWSVRTSDGTNPFYATWCNNAVTFASNDCIICKDVVTIDQTATFKGVLGTGDTTRSVCAIICRSTTPAPATVANLVWQNPPAASYTLTVDGWIVRGAHSGMRIGTSAAPISLANQAIVNIIAATSGTATNSGIVVCNPVYINTNSKDSLFLFGAYPATTRTTLLNAAAAAQPNIVTSVSTGWAVGDRVFIGGCTAMGAGDGTVYTISSIAGANITLGANLSLARSALASIVKLNDYGVVIQAPSAGQVTNWLGFVSGLELRGVLFKYCNLAFAAVGSEEIEDTANKSATQFIDNCAFEMASSGTAPASSAIINYIVPPDVPFQISNTIGVNWPLWQIAFVALSYGADTLTISNCCNLRLALGGQANTISVNASSFAGTLSGGVYDGCNTALININGATGMRMSGVRFWGANSVSGTIFMSGTLFTEFSDNVYENTAYLWGYSSSVIAHVERRPVFGAEVARGFNEVLTYASGYYSALIEDPSIIVRVGAGSNTIDTTRNGTLIRVVDNSGTTNNDQGYLRYGSYQRTGTGLADTTARTAGGYALRLAPTSSTQLLTWPNLVTERAVPTGNIQSKTMTVTAWVYIGNAAYYAGVHTKPTLSVKYDNTTTATAIAAGTAGAWQQLAVVFTPSTTYGQIEVWLSGATDAAGANAYWYVDDVQVAYPAGVSINLGGLDLWANATPVWPPIATFPSLGSVWDEPTAAHAVVGSFGEALSGGGGGGGATAQEVWEYANRTLVPVGGVTHLY